jgi:glycosyltransferase involved in cell wall biosynthesis
MFGAAFLANKHFNLPVVGDLHENYADAIQYYKFSTTFPGNILISSKKWKEKEKEWVSQSDYIITVVEEMKNRIEQYVNSDNVIIYGNYPNLKEFLNYEEDKELLEKYNNKFVITYIGGFDYHRGIDILLESLTFLSGLKDLKLCLIGKGKNLNELKDKINKLNISDKVDFIGWIHSNKLPNYFKLSSIGIIPHLKSVQTDNSSPNKLFQYMAMSVPVISTNCNSLKRMVNESECGLIYEYDNAQDLADKVIQLYKNEKLKKEMGENGKKAVIEKYNWENTSKNLIELYEKIEKIKMNSVSQNQKGKYF